MTPGGWRRTRSRASPQMSTRSASCCGSSSGTCGPSSFLAPRHRCPRGSAPRVEKSCQGRTTRCGSRSPYLHLAASQFHTSCALNFRLYHQSLVGRPLDGYSEKIRALSAEPDWGTKVVLVWARKGSRPELSDGCPADWRQLIQQCWDENPKHRPSMKEVPPPPRSPLPAAHLRPLIWARGAKSRIHRQTGPKEMQKHPSF